MVTMGTKLKVTKEFRAAFKAMDDTWDHIFLTGRAGTGKSTLLKYFRQKTKKKQLSHFGDYQDAIVEGKTFLYHSILSAPINIGLLSPKEVIDYALTSNKKTPLNALEGFIRQIIGWREFVYGVYLVHGKKQKQSNFFRHKNNLPNAFWDASTQLDPVDDTLKRIDKHCYAHHIERLMVLGNILLLLEVHPKQVYTWFMEQFIDSYEWVMIPNVFGMSQYADGGLMVTKPYISSSNYIKKMSDYKKGEWEPLWTALYWRFMIKHKTKLQDIPRMFRQIQLLQRLSPETKQAHIKRAETYLRTLKK
jgi:deoxyribodipyrimidine photolyase-related protein